MQERLRHVVDEIDDIVEPLRPFYAEGEDGRWRLQTEGLVEKARLDEFRQTNIEVSKVKTQLEEQMAAWRALGDEPAKIAEELTELRKIRQKVTDQELVDKKGFEGALEKRTAEMKSTFDGQIRALSARAEEAERGFEEWRAKYRKTVVDRAIQDAALTNGVIPSAIADVLERARRDGWTLNEKDKVVRIQDGEIMFGGDGASPLTAKEWVLGALKDQAPYFFERAGGTGAVSLGGGNVMNNPWHKDSWNLTNQGRLVKEKPALAKALAAQAGVTLKID